VVCSDGLDVGDPEVLREQMARLSRLAHRIVWLNPLKGTRRTSRWRAVCTRRSPFVDVFLSGHNVASLEALGRAL
jgi:uncharacterized protein with von Willebrand factor type A (vWA) domain